MQEQREQLSRMLARCWKRFAKEKKTTYALAGAFWSLGISEKSVELMQFERFTLLIKSVPVIQTLKLLLERLDTRIKLSQIVMGILVDDIDNLLNQVAHPSQRGNERDAMIKGGVKSLESSENQRGNENDVMIEGGVKSLESSENRAKKLKKPLRYLPRVVLCSYMIKQYPQMVFRKNGDDGIALAESAANFIREFELLIRIIMDGPIQTSVENSASEVPSRTTFRSQLKAFDKAWCFYLRCLVIWKAKDAKLLEEDLLNSANDLEHSAPQKCMLLPEVCHGGRAFDTKVTPMQQLMDNKKFFKENVLKLSSSAGSELFVSASSNHHRTEHLVTPSSSCISLPCPSGSSDASTVSISKKGLNEEHRSISLIARALFDRDISDSGGEHGFTSTTGPTGGQHNTGAELASENEIIVNELIHEQGLSFGDCFNSINEEYDNLQAKMREIMEKAFWDGVLDSLRQANPDFGWVLKLMREVRDELCDVSPEKWRQQIVQTIDVDIIAQVLKSGSRDFEYLGNILDFAIVTVEKLSAPASEGEIKSTHQDLMKELREMAQAGNQVDMPLAALLLVKGLRFVLEQIRVLKREISKYRMRMLEPFIKGPSGLEYLRKAFATRYGPPGLASGSLPLTKEWLSSQKSVAEEEWKEYTDVASALECTNSGSLETGGLLPTSLRTGGAIPMMSKSNSPSSTHAGIELPECRGEEADMLVRLGVVKLVSMMGGLTFETLPETLRLNLSRLRSVKSQLQKIVVISTSILILRQTLASENLITNPSDMENTITESVRSLCELLDGKEDVGIHEITDTLGKFLPSSEHLSDPEKLRSRKQVMASTLVRSVQPDDPVFTRVSRAIYTASRAAVLAGKSPKRKHLVDGALRRIGASILSDKLVGAMEALTVVAVVSCKVHGEWYEELLKNL